jgi:hypothetical protein
MVSSYVRKTVIHWFPVYIEFFLIYLILPAALGPGVYSVSNRWVPENIPEGKAWQTRYAENLTAIWESTV